jgi:glycosyltransferase involved in cell wall biosynthesis
MKSQNNIPGKKTLYVKYLFNDSFPIGFANANRIISISKGLICNNTDVEVFILRGTEKYNSINNASVTGNYCSIKYKYTSHSTIWPNSRILKLVNVMRGLFYAFVDIYKAKKQDQVDVIITTLYDFRTNLLFYLLTRILNIKYAYAVDEYPVTVLNSSKYSYIFKHYYNNYFHKMFDIWIVMTNKLIEYYKKYSSKTSLFIHIPMTVEPERFNIYKSHNSHDYIAYCGNLGHNNKDGVDYLIKAFKIFNNKYSNIKLYIIGDLIDHKKEYQDLVILVERLQLTDYIVFTGRVNRDNIPEYLINAKALVLARPDNKQGEGGFPTKLGEYLATGNPVLVTRTGDIPDYLTDGINSFTAKPNDINDFADKLISIFDDYNKASIIGLKGKELTNTYFNANYQGSRLSKYLREIVP